MLNKIERPTGIKKGKKRLGKGQGTGQGHQAGRGHKGSKARSGGQTARYFEGGQMPIYRRLPKRGFKNPFRKEFRIVNLYQLKDLETETIDINVLEQHAIIRSQGQYKDMPVKILADGSDDFSRKLHIVADAFSKSAKEIIEKNGGKAELIKPKPDKRVGKKFVKSVPKAEVK